MFLFRFSQHLGVYFASRTISWSNLFEPSISMLSYVNLRSFALLELLMRIFEAIFDFKGPFASMHIIDWIVWVDGKVVCFRSFAHDLRTSQCSVPRDPIIELSSPPSSKSNAHPSIQPSSHQYLRGSGTHEDTSHSESRGDTC